MIEDARGGRRRDKKRKIKRLIFYDGF